MIRAERLVRKYGSLTAVDGVSFEISKGEIVGLLGHNGAGKTTIIKMLTGYLEPTAGEVFIDGMNIESDRLSIQQKIGYLPENCPLYPEMTVVGYLEYVAELRGVPEGSRTELIREAVRKTSLESKATSFINTLSKGYRQRVGVAQAILNRPEILILDEPTSGLDPSQINEIRSLINELSRHSTIILSTHILQEVQAVCSRVIIVLQGKVALDAKMQDLRHSSRLILSVNRGLEDVRSRLRPINGVGAIKALHSNGGEQQYAIEVVKDHAAVTPLIAKSVVDAGFSLFGLHPERRDLETIFNEINAGTVGGSNAN